MNNENTMLQCPECGIWFSIMWVSNPIGGPEYCPMCGEPMDYKQAYDDIHSNHGLDECY